LPARTQPSIAISADGSRWSVMNASPDIRQQFAAFPGLHPRPGTRDVPIDTVVLTNADLDHCLGLLVLREALSYRILSTKWIRDALLRHNAAFRLLDANWGTAKLDERVPLDAEGRLEARMFPVPGKVPGFLQTDVPQNRPETTVGVRITDRTTGHRLVYVPGAKILDSGTLAELAAAECRFVDGTFYTADELRALRPGAPDAFAMCHVPITGTDGSLEPLSELPGRTFYIHMNNTNPVLDPSSPEAEAVRERGIEIANDGMEFEV
jgi:pyrroloquinoline quinone biosynthesis protein B